MPTKTAAPKTAKPKTAAAKPASPAKAKPVEIAPAAPEAAAKVTVALRVKDLIERVSAAGDFNKKDVRDIVEATLVELGRALDAGESLNLPPFGKMHVRNTRAIDNGGSALTLKVRRGATKAAGQKADNEGLAEANEEG